MPERHRAARNLRHRRLPICCCGATRSAENRALNAAPYSRSIASRFNSGAAAWGTVLVAVARKRRSLRVRPKQCVGPQAASPSQHGERVSVGRQCTQFVGAAEAPERPIWRHDARLIGARGPYRSDGAAGVVARYVQSVAPGGSSRRRSTESPTRYSRLIAAAQVAMRAERQLWRAYPFHPAH
jgi:hypothetical protein